MSEITIENALSIIINNIDKGKKAFHKDYLRVNNLAHLYRQLITGEDADDLLLRYNPRETPEQFEQRKRLTQLVTPALTEKIKSPFYKVPRINNVKKSITFDGVSHEENKEAVSDVNNAMSMFYGEDSLDKYMENQFIDLSFIDPNAFIVVEFDKFNSLDEKAKPFPMIISSHNAINYKYVNNDLKFLLIRIPISIKTDRGIKKGWEYRIYTNNNVIKVRETSAKDDREENNLKIDSEEFIRTKKGSVTIKRVVYTVELFNPETGGEIQACQIGYKRDEITHGRTFVNPFHKAVNRMMKSIKSCSELDLTMALQVFPLKTQYVPKCQGKKGDHCKDGFARNGICEICHGTGSAIVKSSQDILTLPLPRDKDEMIDLDKLINIKSPPIDLPKFMNEYLKQLENEAMQDVFVSESFNRITQTKTLGEAELEIESVYDTLLPFGNKYSFVWRKFVKLIATFTDNGDNIEVVHSLPKDLKLKSINQLLDDRQKAITANLPSDLVREIDTDIAMKMFVDNGNKMSEYNIKQEHLPFKGKTDAQIQIAMNMSLTNMFDKILWSNFDRIFGELEAESMAKKLNFYELSYDRRVELIKEKVAEYIQSIEDENTTAQPVDFNDDDLDEGLDDEGNQIVDPELDEEGNPIIPDEEES